MKRLLKIPYILLALSLSVLLCSCATIPQSQQNTFGVSADTYPLQTTYVEATIETSEAPTTVYTEPTYEATVDSITEATEITEPPHIHNFSAATCTSAKTCSCGATEGTAADHSWIPANCYNPKTCDYCGTTSGSATGHTYSGGYCKFCGETDSSYFDADSDMVWIPTKGGKKYHAHSGCSNMIDPDYVSQTEATSRGFTPCKKCY